MGLETRAEGNIIGIYKGKLCQRVTKEVDGAIARILEKGENAGKTVYEKYYDSFTGKLVDVKTTEGKYGRQWVFSFKDQKEIYNLCLPYSNSFAKNFLKMLPNADLTKVMKVSPMTKEVDGKNKSSLFINQDGVALKHAYTKENMNGLPQMVQVRVKGELVWDDTAVLEFLHAMVERDIRPKLEGIKVEAKEGEVVTADPLENYGKEVPVDPTNEDAF